MNSREWKPLPLRMRSIVKACNSMCDICGRHRNAYSDHSRCSKIRQARRLASMRA